MCSRSSTSSSESRPRAWIALAVAAVLVVAGEAAFHLSHERLMGFEECILLWKRDVIRDPDRHDDVVVLGASRVVHGVVPGELSAVWGGDISCVNLAINGCPVETLYVMLDQYLAHHPPPRAVIASVVPLFLGSKKPPAGGFEVRSLYRLRDIAALGSDAGVDAYMDWLEGRVPSRKRRGLVRRGIQRWDFRFAAEGEYEGLIHRRPGQLWRRLNDEAGYTPFVSGPLDPRKRRQSAYFRTRFEVLPVHRRYLERLFSRCRSEGIPLYLFATPVPRTLYNHNSNRGYNRKVTGFWDRLLPRFPNVCWVGPRIRAMDDALFADWWCHPTEAGARRFSRELASELSAAGGGPPVSGEKKVDNSTAAPY